MQLHLDFETYSAQPLGTVGGHRYSEDPTTETLMLSYKVDAGDTKLWVPSWNLSEAPESDLEELLMYLGTNCAITVSDLPPTDLAYALIEADELWAHNANFERALFERCPNLTSKVTIPSTGSRWRCTQALGALLSLPPSLEKLALYLGITEKDTRGKALIKMFSVPQKPTKKNNMTERIYPWDKPSEFLEFCEYCIQDTEVESAIHQRLVSHLPTKYEQSVWALDSDMNMRGIPMDIETTQLSYDMIAKYAGQENDKFKAETGLNHTQRDKVKAWFNERFTDIGVEPLENMQAGTLDDLLASKILPEDLHRLIKIKRSLGRSSTAKLKVILLATSEDGRMRGTLKYHGAQTGRWAGRLLQPQNLPRPSIKDTFVALELVQHGDLDMIENVYGDPLQVVSSIIRHLINVPEGKTLYVADYASIEARVLCWLAGQNDVVKLYFEGDDRWLTNSNKSLSFDAYVDMASAIYRCPTSDIDEFRRARGKETVLGCGYSMGAKTFMSTCLDKGIDINMKEASRCVNTFRNRYSKVNQYWDRCERAMQKAIKTGKPQKVGVVTFFVDDIFCKIKLPSGRCLAYPEPKVEKKMMPWGEEKDVVTFYGPIPNTVHWGRNSTYGGKIVENITQAVARDLTAYGMTSAEEAGYSVITSIHDEILSETDENFGTLEEFERAICRKPEWAEGIPLMSEGYQANRYRK